MAITWEVTTPETTRETTDGKTEFSFTIKNITQGAARGQVRVIAEPPAKAEWFAVSGSTLVGSQWLDLPAGGVGQVTVTFSAPDAPAGNHLFFVVIAEAIPDQNSDRSPTCSVIKKGQVVEKKRPVGLLIGLAALVVVVGVILALFFALRPKNVEVPGDLAGTEIEAAVKRLEGLDLKAKTVQQASSTVDSGKVIGTDPQAGRSVKEGASVEVFVSTGPKQVQIPPLEGNQIAQAAQKLGSLGLGVTPVEQTHRSVRSGTVITTDPTAGQSVKEGASVKVMVSIGPGPIPNVAGKSERDAENILRSAGFSTEVAHLASDTVAAGLVVGTFPPAGTKLSVGQGVTLRVSLGKPPPESIKLPARSAVVGKQAEDATNALLNASQVCIGKCVKVVRQCMYIFMVQKDSVLSMTPDGGSLVKVGDPVYLGVNCL